MRAETFALRSVIHAVSLNFSVSVLHSRPFVSIRGSKHLMGLRQDYRLVIELINDPF